jgi:integration host factor subunit alpha
MECRRLHRAVPLDRGLRSDLLSSGERRDGSMTKAEIARAVQSRVQDLSLKEAAELVDLVFETMKEMLGRGEKIKVSGFGNWVLRDKDQRRGRNPQTGKTIVLAARRVLTFRESPVLKLVLNPRQNDDTAAVAADE